MNDSELEKKVLDGQKSNSHHKIQITIGIVLIALIAVAAAIYFITNFNLSNAESEPELIYINGVAYAPDITEITISDSDIADYSVLKQFKNLQKADLSGQDLTVEQYEKISQLLKGVEILWKVPFNGTKYISNIESLTLTADIPQSELAVIKYFTGLKSIYAEDYPLCDELYNVMQQVTVSGSDCSFTCKSQIYGKDIDSSSTELILNQMKISDLSELRNAVKFFPNLTKIEMCDCGLSNETMSELRDEYPQILFVWKVSFLKYRVRTDILVFSTLVDVDDPIFGTQDDFLPLFKYCTELRALDLGHHRIKDISEIKNLKKLQVLVLADNIINDISPLAELKDLHYIELFFNNISDVSPLAKLEKLEDLNICYNPNITNSTELIKCKNLKRLYISHCNLDNQEISTLKNGVPSDCEFNTTVNNAVRQGWRVNDKNAAIRKAFSRWNRVAAYEDWAHVTYKW